MDKELIVYTDGSCKIRRYSTNGKGVVGWAYVMIIGDKVIERSGSAKKFKEVLYCEMLAVTKATSYLIQKDIEFDKCIFYIDSMALIEKLKEYKIKFTGPKFKDKVEFIWSRRCSNPYQERCDFLAKQASLNNILTKQKQNNKKRKRFKR